VCLIVNVVAAEQYIEDRQRWPVDGSSRYSENVSIDVQISEAITLRFTL